jgi:hypothetical protein
LGFRLMDFLTCWIPDHKNLWGTLRFIFKVEVYLR